MGAGGATAGDGVGEAAGDGGADEDPYSSGSIPGGGMRSGEWMTSVVWKGADTSTLVTMLESKSTVPAVGGSNSKVSTGIVQWWYWYNPKGHHATREC